MRTVAKGGRGRASRVYRSLSSRIHFHSIYIRLSSCPLLLHNHPFTTTFVILKTCAVKSRYISFTAVLAHLVCHGGRNHFCGLVISRSIIDDPSSIKSPSAQNAIMFVHTLHTQPLRNSLRHLHFHTQPLRNSLHLLHSQAR